MLSTIIPGMEKKGGADTLPGPTAGGTGQTSSDEDAGPSTLRAPKKEASKKVKKTQSGPCRRDASDTKSEDSSDHPSSEDEEEEEEDESLTGGGKKRTDSSSLEAESPNRGKGFLPEASTMAADSSPEWDPRA